MTGTRASNRLARRGGTDGERHARAEGLPVAVSNNFNLTDGDGVEVKTAQVTVSDQGGLRTGRFRFHAEQHRALAARDGVYHFRLAMGPGDTVKLCEVPARRLHVPRDGTRPWDRVCEADDAGEG